MVRSTLLIFICLINSIVYGQFRAVYIPEDKLPDMKTDGDTSDWGWVPKRYIITEKSMYNVDHLSNKGWSCQIKTGWSDLNNKLYVIAKITDDRLIIDNPTFFYNDIMQFAVNTANTGGRYGGKDIRTKYVIKSRFLFNSDKKRALVVATGPKWITGHGKKYIDWSIQNSRNKKGEFITIYEMCLSLWDKWDEAGPEFSTPCELHSQKRIRLCLAFDDSDLHNNTRNAEWVTPGGIYWYNNVDHLSEFILDAPVQRGVSWQHIDGVLRPVAGDRWQNGLLLVK